jgi:uncharacterized RDD family membrane protein YckC
MFTIIGGDGREYGPATAEQIRSWIAAGRANLDTKAKTLGSDEWRRLGDFAEFATPSAPPPVVGAPPSPEFSPGVPVSATPMPAMPAASYGTMPVTAATTANLAERGPRLLARFIDWVLAILARTPGAVILGSEFMKVIMAVMQGRQPEIEDLDMHRLILGGVAMGSGWLLLLIIQVWMLTTRGQSIGKRIVGVRVIRLDGSKPGIVHAWLLREVPMTVIGTVLGFLPFIGPFLLGPGFHLTDWCMIFRDDQRCLHDLFAGTKVVKA